MAESGVTQRVAAILAADAAGYSRLMAADEPATIDALDAARAVFIEHIESNHGRVVDTAGDSVLAVFETTEGAAVAAAAIQARLGELNAPVPADRRMPFRIGLHLGDIREKADGTVYGDGVNVAARLEGLAEPGRIVVSGSVHDSIRGRHGLTYHFLGEQEVKNIAEPVRAYRVLAEGETAPAAPRSGRRLILAGVAVALLALVVAFLWPADHHESLPEVTTAEPEDPILAMPTGPSIAVLPFDNMSGDPEQEFFGDGLAEEIIAGLSRFSNLRVLARNSTFQFKGQSTDVRAIGESIGAQYVVEGSVRKAGDQVRVSAQLLNADDGSHLWSENYEATLTPQNLFHVQDAITAQIVSRLGDVHGAINRNAIEHVRRKAPSDLRSYDCVLLAYEYQRFLTPDKHANVKSCLQQAVQDNPGYSDAWANLSYTYVDQYWSGYDGPPNPLDLGYEAARKAVNLDPTNQLGYYQLANVHFFTNDQEQFALEAERALELNPNNTEILAALAIRLVYVGERERGLALMGKAIQLNPAHPGWYWYPIVYHHYINRDYETALEYTRRINMPGFFYSHFWFAAIHGQLGNVEAAKEAATELNRLNPGFKDDPTRFMGMWFKSQDAMDHLIEGLEKAGLFDEPEAPTHPIIAVLPFDSMSEDPAHQFFADGVAEDIITRLARFPDIGVIARNSSFQYQGENVDVRAVADALGATYVLEGSVRRSENDIRVIAQLLDASDGTHLWAETYDRDLTAGSVFEIQDDITERVVGAIASSDSIIAMAVTEASAGKVPADLASYECVMRALDFWRVITPDAHLAARTCLERVISEEPDYAQAYVVLTGITIDEMLYGYNPQPELAPALDRALRYAERAIDLDRTSGWSHWALARVLYFRHDLGGFRTEAERAVALAPNDAMLLGGAGAHLCYSGSWERGFALMERAIELNPHHQTWYHIPYFYDAYRKGQDEDALAAARRINMPGFFWTYLMLAAAYGQLDMASEATGAVATLQELWPGYTIQMMIELHQLWNYEDDAIERMADGLRKAGLPEGTE